MINENDIRRYIIAALLNEPILGQNYVDYHNENDECCVRIMYPGKHFDIIVKEVLEEAYIETYNDYRE